MLTDIPSGVPVRFLYTITSWLHYLDLFRSFSK